VLWKQTVMTKRVCYKNQEPLILAMNLGMKLIGWGGAFMVWESLQLVIGVDKVCYCRYAIFQLIFFKINLLKCRCGGNLLHLQRNNCQVKNN